MRCRIPVIPACFILLTALAAGLSAQEPEPLEEAGLLLKTLSLPVDRPGDLAWDGEALWVSDWEAGILLRIDPENGGVLKEMPAPCYRPRGLAWGEGSLYIADDFKGLIHVLDPESGVTTAAYRTPSGTGLGLAWDGTALWLSDDGPDNLQKLIPEDGTSLTYFPAPEREPGGLAFDGTYLWVAHRLHDRIFMVDPETGKALTSFDAPGPYPCGIAATADGRLWIADFERGQAYLCAPREARPYQTSDRRESRIRMTYRLENHGPGVIQDATVHFAVPRSLRHLEMIGDPEYFPAAPQRHKDIWNEEVATFTRAEIPPGGRFEAGYT
ncbi:MAG: hypothetical protein GF355_14015, partial [Candidatus Eisenbacteria bacterium]|nr:hypothetical protein [Candidatus Eisenbacteria bacterium]